jgi:hypothetical protein
MMKMTKRKAAIASAVMVAAVLGAIAIKKSHHDPAADASASGTAPAATDTATAAAASPATAAATTTTAAAAQPAPFPPPIDTSTTLGAPAPSEGALASADDEVEPSAHAHRKHTHVTPFGNGPVHHGNVLRIKMDGPIESIEGAQQPTGFAVKVPGRKSLEAAAPLAARDSRIAGIKVANDIAGAELTVAFKDGVPNYQVMARGDTLVIALAPAGALDKLEKTVADKDERGGTSPKHGKHDHKKPHDAQ